MACASSSISLTKSTDAGGGGTETLRRSRILSSKLYFDVPLSKVPVIYSASYDIAFLGIEKLHPFDSSKWGRICQFLIKEGILDKNRVVEPREASKDDLLVVHTESYLNSLNNSLTVSIIVERMPGHVYLVSSLFVLFASIFRMLNHKAIRTCLPLYALDADPCSLLEFIKPFKDIIPPIEENPDVPPVALLPNCLVQKKVLYPFRKQVGGSILAAKLAKERGWAINVGGGFHHCSAEKGGGFCVYADISLCIQYAFVRLNISRVMIIDLDAHQGNGHETDFSNDSRVYILDMYNSQIYPFDYEAKRSIDQKVELMSGTNTKEYLQQLDKALEVAKIKFDPELVVYNAGTDILDGDPLGRLKVSPDGVAIRDEKVFRFAREKDIPLLMLTSGGYMKSSARVIADSITNLSKKRLIDLDSLQSRK